MKQATELSKLKVADVMSRAPRAIDPHQSLESARSWMDDLHVHHLPVRDAGKVVGIVSDRDLNLLLGVDHGSSMNRHTTTHKKYTVADAMISSLHTVREDRLLTDVAAEMIAHRVGSAIVLNPNGDLTGIFTTTDALRVLASRN